MLLYERWILPPIRFRGECHAFLLRYFTLLMEGVDASGSGC